MNAPALAGELTAPSAQAARAVLMVRPQSFCSNPQTQASNAFQRASREPQGAVLARAQREFEAAAEQLRAHGVEVLVLEEACEAGTPDALFPNNWFSTHANGDLVLYPMAVANRRLERRPQALRELLQGGGFRIQAVRDLSALEHQGTYVEGTGSLVLDRPHRIAYAARSSRTMDAGVQAACGALGFEAVLFTALDGAARAIYHTNVLMSVGPKLALLGAGLIPDQRERARVTETLAASGHELVLLNLAQIEAFAGNVLFLESREGAALVAISRRAWQSLAPFQRRQLERAARPIVCDVATIEASGGGGIRCMLAEIFLPRAVLQGQARVRSETSRHGVSAP